MYAAGLGFLCRVNLRKGVSACQGRLRVLGDETVYDEEPVGAHVRRGVGAAVVLPTSIQHKQGEESDRRMNMNSCLATEKN